MPIRQNILRKGKAQRQNLQSFDVHIDESGVVGDLTVSKFFKISEFPSVLPAGNSSFLIEGSNLLKPDIELKIEILDRENNPIFHYAIPNYDRELPSQRVAIEVYKDDIVDGIGTITILAELDPEENNIPEQFLDTYNVRFTAPININTTIKNTRPIRFFGAPIISVSEKVVGVKKPVDSNSLIPITLTGSVEVNTQRHYYPSSPTGGGADTYIPDTDTSSNNPEEEAIIKYQQTKASGEESQPQQIDKAEENPNVPIPGYDIGQTMILKELENSEYSEPNKLSRDMSGASFTIRNVNLIAKDEFNNSISGSTEYELPTSFSDVLGIRNETTFFTLGKELTANNLKTNQREAIGVFASSSNFELTFKPKTENVPDQVYKKSYADITVGNLQTFSGDTYKAKIYAKEDGSSGGFEKIYETLVESPNQLVDLNSLTGFKNIGSFTTQSIVQNYWVTSSVQSSATIDNSLLMNSVVLSGSNYQDGQSFDFVTNQNVILENNEPYLVEFVTAIKSAPKLQSDGTEKTEAKLEVFLTGSFQSSTQGEISLGIVDISENLFNSFDSNEFNLVEKTQVADFLSHNESSKPSGSLGFRVHSGQFMLNNVRLRPFSETNFSPGFFKANVPMPKPIKRGQLYDFLVEFYDANNNKAKAVAIADDVLFDGAPQVIADGVDAVLTGSMFLGNITGSGIELHGGSAYMRSIGYDGFDDTIANSGGGFIIFSGSVQSQIGASEAYEGVGLELVDAHGSTNRFLKFKTNAQGTPSEFEVQTDTFYFGKERTETNAQFVSGSNGNVEISSSNFHLTPDGDVVMQGTITAEAGNIGGFSIDPTSMFSGTQPTPTFFLSGSATGTNFSKSNLVISSSGFQVNSQGAMSASEGVIGGFSLGQTTISSNNLILDSSGEIRNQDYDPFLSGFKISSLGNGSAEFENIRIRGTLRTSVFEKETVNAVGGMLYVGNSTAVSASVGSSDTAIFVDNVSGFEVDEVVFAKKVTGTGFTKEFMKVTGSHRHNESSDTDFAGFLHVERAYGSSVASTKLSNATTLNGAIDSTQTRITVASTANLTGTPVIKIDDELMKVTGSDSTSPGTIIHAFRGIDGTAKASHSNSTNVKLLDKDASFLANLVSSAQTYTPGQVLVSTGRYIGGTGTNTTGSGYIMLNANPTIGDTPYIDFAERTGSGLYDMRLRTRVGDLSGLSGTRLGDEVVIGSEPGFGLAAENVFLSGLIKAQSGSIGGWEIQDQQIKSGVTSLNSSTEQLKFDKTSVAFGSGTGVMVGKDGNDYEFYAGNGSNYIWWDGSNLNIKGAIRQTAGGTTLVDYADRGIWAAGVAYKELDLVQYTSGGATSTYKCIDDHTSTDNTSTSTGRPDTTNSTCWTIFASGGTTGATSKTVSIQASSYVAVYNSSGGGGTGTITLSANSQNFTDARFKFTGGGTDFTDQTTFTDGSDNNTSQNVTFNIPSSDTNAPYTFQVDVQEGTSGGSVASDTLTIAAIKPGTDGTDGSTSKVVSLTSPNYIINYDAAGSNPTPSGTLTLTATSQNFTNGFFKFTGDGLSDEGSFTDGSGANADTFSYTIPSSHFSTPKSIRVGVSEGDQNEVAFDTITLVAVKPGDDGDDGADAYTVVLTNESHTLPTTDDGTITHAGSGTEIIAYKGTTQLTGVTGGGTPSAGQFTVTTSDSNITVGSESASNSKLVFGDASSMSAGSDTASITFTVKLEGASTTITKIQSLSKANQGDGAITVINTNQAHTLPASNAGVVSSYTNSGTTIKAFEGTRQLDYDGSGTTAGHFTITTSQSPSSTITIGNISDSTNDAVVANHSSMVDGTDSVLITYTISGKRFDGTAFSVETTQTITKSKVGITGTSATTLNLTSNIAVFAFDDSSDTSPTPSTATITINQQNQASNLVTGDISVVNGSKSGFSYSAGSGTGTGTATVTITPSGTYPVTVSVTNDGISDSLQIPKVQGGADGTDGVDGLTIVNSNPTHTLPAPSTGIVSSHSDSGTTIRVFEGTTELNSVSGTPTAGQYKVTTGQSPSGTITIGTIGVTGDAAVVPDHSGMANNINNVVITYTITGKRADGTDFTLTTSQSIGKNKSGTPGQDGSNAQVISLSSDAMAFRVAKDGTVTPSTITFTAKRQNISNSTTFSSTPSLTLGGSGDTATLTATEFDDNTSVKVTATAGSFSDDITIVRLTEGSDAVTSTNSNPAHLFPADSSGNITNSGVNSGTTIKVFEGTTALTFKTSTAAAGQFNIGTPTISTGTKSGGAISGNNTTTATVADYSDMSADAAVITYPISGKRADGTAFSFDIKQSFSKSKTGTAGASGTDSKVVSLSASSNVIEYNAAGGGGSGTITLTATSQNFTNAFFKFTGGGGAFTDETSYTDGSGANSDTATFTIPTNYSSTPYTFTVSVQEGNSGGEVASDTISIASIKPGTDGDDGEDAYTIFLTNETHSFPAANNGTVDSSDLADGSFEVRIFKGTTQLTLDDSSPYGANTYRTSKVQTGIALTASTNSSQRKFTPTSVTADSGTAVITIIDNSDSSSFTKTYTFSKSKAGATGATGASLNIIFIRSASQPSTPNASSGVPSGWADSPGGTSGTNLLWAAQGTKSVGSSTFTWGTPYQVEGTATAEVAVYKKASSVTTPTGGSYNFTNGTLTAPTGWSTSVPTLSSNGDKVYLAVGLFTGSPTEDTATTTWSTPVLYAQKTDGQDGAPGATGATGAGVVFRGDWNNSATYTKSDIRRDIVDYSAVNSSNPFWIAKNTNSNSAPPSSGTSANTNWEAFGATFTSVATDILFAQDVYADKTVNIGSSGGSNLISLNANTGSSGANPYITVGQGATQGFGNSGIFLGYESTTPKLSLVNSGGTRFFKWDGSDLDIQTSNLLVSSSAGSGVNQKDLIIDSSTPAIRLQFGATLNNLIDLKGDTGVIEVFTGGEKIFNSGEAEVFNIKEDRIINSAPQGSSGNTATTKPFTRLLRTKVNEFIDIAGVAKFNDKIIQIQDSNVSANINGTSFLSEVDGTISSTSAPSSTPANHVFNTKKTYSSGNAAGHLVMQSAVFSTEINSSVTSTGIKFTDSGNTNASSSLYQFQGILEDGLAPGLFEDAKACLMSLDMVTESLPSNKRQEFVYLQARRDIGEPAGLKTVFQVQGANGAIATAGNITAFAGSFNSVSDRRLKRDIHTISGSMNKVLQLRPTEFTWIEQDKQDIGFIAQEVEEIIPEVIETTDGFVDSETGEKSHENTKTISYTKLIPYLVDTIQQMDKKIKELEKKVK